MEKISFFDLVAGISEQWLCEYLEVNSKTIKRWKKGTTDAPHAIRLLLRIALDGDLSAFGGKDWEGFNIGQKDHKLYMPLHHGGFTPERMQELFFTNQRARWYEKEMNRLQRELNELKSKTVLQGGGGDNSKMEFYSLKTNQLTAHAG